MRKTAGRLTVACLLAMWSAQTSHGDGTRRGLYVCATDMGLLSAVVRFAHVARWLSGVGSRRATAPTGTAWFGHVRVCIRDCSLRSGLPAFFAGLALV